MRKIYLSLLVLTGLLMTLSAGAQIKIGTNGATIAPSSLLELESANQGLLLPRMADTVAINALNPPNGMLIYLTKAPAVGLYVRKVTGWEYLTGSLGGNGNFNSLTVAGTVTAGNFSGPLNGNATSATTAATANNSLNSAVTNDISTLAEFYPTFVSRSPGNQPLITSTPKLRYEPSRGIFSAPQFVGDLTGNVNGTSVSSTDAQNAVNIRITDEQFTGTTYYPVLVTGTGGPLPPHISRSRLAFTPGTGELTASLFRGDLTGNAGSASTVSGMVAAGNGGTGQSNYNTGDMLVATTSVNLSKLAIGPVGTVLRVGAGNLPAWSTAGAGTVTRVIGTANRIDIGPDPTIVPQVDISTSYVGQTSINTLGTVTTGTWNGTVVDAAHGGTGLASLPSGVLIGNGTGPVTTTTGAAGLVLTSTGLTTPPTYQPIGVGDMVLNLPQTVTGAKTFGSVGDVGKLVIAGNTGGLTTLNAQSGSTGTVVLPSTGIIASLDGIEILNNKTINSPNLTGTPNIGTAIGTSLTTSSNITAPILVSTIGVGTPPFTVTSTTPVPNLNIGGNAFSATSAVNFTGTLNGQVGGTQGATVINSIGSGNTPANNIETGANLAFNSTSAPTGDFIVRRNASGNFSANVITADLTGDVTGSLFGNATTATSALSATDAVNTGITNTNTNSTFYPTFVENTSGNRPQRVSSTNYTFNPGTGALYAGSFVSTNTVGAPFTVASATPVSGLNILGNASTVTTNADLSGPITSSGNNTTIASQTGTGTTFAMSVNPTFTGANGVTSTQFRLSALNTPPASAVDTGVAGEIRITATFIYVCIAANTWVRAALTTF